MSQEIIDKNRLPAYQDGAEGCIKFIEENVKFEVPDRNGRPKWMYPTQMSSEPDPVTGKSFAQLWENQKDELREALAMENGKFKYRVVVFCWPRGEGKCEAKGSEVLMYDGTIKKVEDVKVGDQLMGDDNTPRNVLSLANGKEEMYEVVPMRGESKVVTKDHVLSLKRRQRGKDDGRPDNKAGQVFDISVEDYLKQSNYFKNMTLLYKVPIDWPEQEVPIDPYFLGLWLGDGNSSDPSITTMDKEVVDYVYKVVDNWNLCVTPKEKKNKKNKAKTYSIVNPDEQDGTKGTNSLLNCFRNNNLLNNKHIPQEYKSNSRDVRLKILAGLVDSDGYINRNSIQFSQKDKKLVDDIAFIARSLGLHAEYTEKIINSKTYYTLGISGDCSVIPTKIPRKQCSPRSDWKDVLVTGIKEIRSVGKREYYGFNIDGNGRYVTGDFTVTHNSLMVCLIQLWKFFCFPGQLIVFGALSKDQTKFVHYDITKSILLNSPKLLNVVGSKQVQQGMFFIKGRNNDIISSIRPISSYTGIVSNITGYTFSEMFALKDFNFFYQLDGSTRNIINGLGTIDSTVSSKEHVLYKLYQGYKDGSDPLTYFSHRSAPNADPQEFWHPLMDQSQISSYKAKFPPAEFDRYFRNVWGLDSGKLFPAPVVNSVFHYAYIDSRTGDRKLDNGNVLSICNEINHEYVRVNEGDGRKNKNRKRVRKVKRRKNKENSRDKIARLESRLVPTDNLYTLQRSGLPKQASIDDLLRLSEIYDTDWSIHAGIDRSDPMAMESMARTIVTVVAKGLTGSRSSRNIGQNEEVPQYIYFLLQLAHVPDATLEGIKGVLRDAIWEYDGIDTLCSERWGAWDLAPWCEDYEIQFEAIFPSFDLQRKAFNELFVIVNGGRFKSSEIVVPGSKMSNILREEMELFDHDPDKRWYGSPQKDERNGIQDDSIFSLAWGIYGGRNFGIDDFRDRKNGSGFGYFLPDNRNLASYNL